MRLFSMTVMLVLAPLLAHGQAVPAAPFDLRAALLQGLASSPEVAIARAVQVQGEAQAISAAAPFDTVASAAVGALRDVRPLRADERGRFGSAGADQQVEQGTLSLGASRMLASGQQLAASYAYSRTNDNVLRAQNAGTQGSERLSLTLRLPLLKNPGTEASAAREASRLEAVAARHDTLQVLARTVLSVTTAYWDWAARLQSQAVANGSQARIVQLRRETAKLIEQDELPPAEINLLDAAVSERTSAAIGAEQRARDARYALARLYGLDGVQAQALPEPSAALPSEARDASALAALAQHALDRRSDLAALRLREQAMAARLHSARENNKSNLDLDLSAYMAGLRESGRPAAATILQTERSAGPGVAARLAWQWPVANSANRGALQAAQANADAARLRRESHQHNVLAAVDAAYRAYASAAAQLANASTAVERYRAALRDSQSKRLLGSATLIDVLNVEDRLNNAVLAQVQYQQGYAAARAQLLYECGALLQTGADGDVTVDLARLLP
jgi:outer membrane protein TolC